MHLVRNKNDSSDILINVFVLSSKPELYRLTDNRTMYVTRPAIVMLLDVWKVTIHVAVGGGINFPNSGKLPIWLYIFPSPIREYFIPFGD